MKRCGINIAPRTLRKHESQGVIPAGYSSGAGKGKGSIKIYPHETVAEAYASYKLKQFYNLTWDEVAHVRSIARGECNNVKYILEATCWHIFKLFYIYLPLEKTANYNPQDIDLNEPVSLLDLILHTMLQFNYTVISIWKELLSQMDAG